MQKPHFLITIAALLFIKQLAIAQRPFSAADTLALQTIGEVAPSPDGKIIVFSVASIDLAGNKNISRLMRISAGRRRAIDWRSSRHMKKHRPSTHWTSRPAKQIGFAIIDARTAFCRMRATCSHGRPTANRSRSRGRWIPILPCRILW